MGQLSRSINELLDYTEKEKMYEKINLYSYSLL